MLISVTLSRELKKIKKDKELTMFKRRRSRRNVKKKEDGDYEKRI